MITGAASPFASQVKGVRLQTSKVATTSESRKRAGACLCKHRIFLDSMLCLCSAYSQYRCIPEIQIRSDCRIDLWSTPIGDKCHNHLFLLQEVIASNLRETAIIRRKQRKWLLQIRIKSDEKALTTDSSSEVSSVSLHIDLSPGT